MCPLLLTLVFQNRNTTSVHYFTFGRKTNVSVTDLSATFELPSQMWPVPAVTCDRGGSQPLWSVISSFNTAEMGPAVSITVQK